MTLQPNAGRNHHHNLLQARHLQAVVLRYCAPIIISAFQHLFASQVGNSYIFGPVLKVSFLRRDYGNYFCRIGFSLVKRMFVMYCVLSYCVPGL
jgi:hypothetical protein